MKNDGEALAYASQCLRNDREIVLEAVMCGHRDDDESSGPLEFASEDLRNDQDIVLEAVKGSEYALQFASEDLQNDREIIF